MSNNAEEVLIGADGAIWTAPVGSVEPASISDPVDATVWTELGYASEDGVKFADSKTVKNVRAWQSFYDIRRFITERSFTSNFTLQQFNGDNVILALGGGDVVEDAPGEFSYHPPEVSFIDERALIHEWADGDKNYRLIFRRAMNEENTKFDISRGKEAGLPMTFAILGEDGVEPYILQTDDPAFLAAVGSGS
jgi:hypothetical protein